MRFVRLAAEREILRQSALDQRRVEPGIGGAASQRGQCLARPAAVDRIEQSGDVIRVVQHCLLGSAPGHIRRNPRDAQHRQHFQQLGGAIRVGQIHLACR
jgi:hypothetical protein